VPKALLKSVPITITYGLVDNRSVIDCRIAMRAVVVELVGRKAYWSLKDSVVGL